MRHLLREGEGEIPPYYANMLHRQAMGKKWTDITGEAVEPRYITQTDHWYLRWVWSTAPKPRG